MRENISFETRTKKQPVEVGLEGSFDVKGSERKENVEENPNRNFIERIRSVYDRVRGLSLKNFKERVRKVSGIKDSDVEAALTDEVTKAMQDIEREASYVLGAVRENADGFVDGENPVETSDVGAESISHDSSVERAEVTKETTVENNKELGTERFDGIVESIREEIADLKKQISELKMSLQERRSGIGNKMKNAFSQEFRKESFEKHDELFYKERGVESLFRVLGDFERVPEERKKLANVLFGYIDISPEQIQKNILQGRIGGKSIPYSKNGENIARLELLEKVMRYYSHLDADFVEIVADGVRKGTFPKDFNHLEEVFRSYGEISRVSVSGTTLSSEEKRMIFHQVGFLDYGDRGLFLAILGENSGDVKSSLSFFEVLQGKSREQKGLLLNLFRTLRARGIESSFNPVGIEADLLLRIYAENPKDKPYDFLDKFVDFVQQFRNIPDGEEKEKILAMAIRRGKGVLDESSVGHARYILRELKRVPLGLREKVFESFDSGEFWSISEATSFFEVRQSIETTSDLNDEERAAVLSLEGVGRFPRNDEGLKHALWEIKDTKRLFEKGDPNGRLDSLKEKGIHSAVEWANFYSASVREIVQELASHKITPDVFDHNQINERAYRENIQKLADELLSISDKSIRIDVISLIPFYFRYANLPDKQSLDILRGFSEMNSEKKSAVKEFIEKRGFSNSDINYLKEAMQFVSDIWEKNGPEGFARCMSLYERFLQSPSAEIKNLNKELLDLSWASDNPEQAAERIENIFLKNNIPLVGKQYKVFEALYPNDRFRKSFQNHSSPVLMEMGSFNRRRLVIFKDLLRVNFDSANSNMEQYLGMMKEGSGVLEKYEKGEKLDVEEEAHLRYFFRKVNALSENIRKGTTALDQNEEHDLSEELSLLRKNFQVREGQTVKEHFEETFLKRIGIKDVEGAMAYMEERKRQTDTRNRASVHDGSVPIRSGDLIKGFDSRFLDKLLDRGFVSPEFVGAETSDAKTKSKQGDATPWDTDLERVKEMSISEALEKSSLAGGYGDIVAIIRNRGQFNETKIGEPAIDDGRMELFESGVLKSDHMGIRTGFGSTEIDALIAKGIVSERSMDDIRFSIAKKGFYIPVVDRSGRVIFTPEEFDEYRKIFRGLDRYHGDPMSVSEDWRQSPHVNEVESIAQTKENIAYLESAGDTLRDELKGLLAESGIALRAEKFDDGVAGAVVIDTGSTGRGAALDGSIDFDFVLKVNDNDFEKAKVVVEKMKEHYPLDTSYEVNGMQTYRFKGFERDGKHIDLDVSVVRKSDSESMDTNEAISRKYESIRKNFGEEALLDVLSNVRFAKKKLKEAGCYKKGINRSAGQQGGLGGIGVETWILKHDGDAVRAFTEFYANAYENGSPLSFENFKKKYKVFGAGENIRGDIRSENFVEKMDEAGYLKMAEVAKSIVEMK